MTTEKSSPAAASAPQTTHQASTLKHDSDTANMTMVADQAADSEKSTAKPTRSSGSQPIKMETDGQADQGGQTNQVGEHHGKRKNEDDLGGEDKKVSGLGWWLGHNAGDQSSES